MTWNLSNLSIYMEQVRWNLILMPLTLTRVSWATSLTLSTIAIIKSDLWSYKIYLDNVVEIFSFFLSRYYYAKHWTPFITGWLHDLNFQLWWANNNIEQTGCYLIANDFRKKWDDSLFIYIIFVSQVIINTFF